MNSNIRGFKVLDADGNIARFVVDGTGAVKIGPNGSLVFPDGTVQTSAAQGRNRPLNNLNLDGGTASTQFEVDLTFVECGGSYIRGILSQDTFDGGDNNSISNATFNNILDGGNA
jgi:hypothetical protein